MANSNKTKFISNISKRFSEIFEKSKPTVITMEPSESQRTLNTYDKNSIFQNKTNKVVPFYEETRYSRRKNDKSLTEIRKKMKTYPNKGSFLFQTLMKTNSHNSDENYEFENEGIFNYNDKQEKFELLNQLQQILSKDDNEEDYKLVKLLKNEGEEIKNELGMIDLFEKESEKFEKLSFQHSCLLVQKKNSFELLQIYADSYPYLGFRKSLLYIKILTSFYCEALIKLQFFKNFIFFVIILNSFVMALEDTRKEDPVFLQMEKFFLIVYTIEMLLKIFGMGLIWRKKSYFRDSWNVFDFVIIMTSYLPLIISTSVESFKFSSFKILRILRPLRTISSIKSLHLIFLTLVTSLPLLFDILIILGFFFLSFAIVGNNLFSDLLKNRCFDPVNGLKSSLGDVLCGYESCKDFFICGKMISNPNYEVMNFDNIFYSLIMVFQCITLQSWSYIMFSIVKVFNPWSEIYFIIIIIFGAFFLLNLTLAVIKTKFTDVQKIQKTGLINDATIKDGANDLNVLDLKRFKKIERTHFKRRKLDIEGIGASKENHSKMNELTWENLFELKERIKEEKEREEADKKFREEREENLKDEEKFVLYKKKIEQKKKKSFNIFLSQISSKKKIQDTQISSSMAFQKLGIKEFQNENNADKENLNEKELNDMEKLLDHNFIFFPKSIKKFIDHDNLQLNDLKEITKNPKSKLKFSNFLDSLLNNQPDDINVNAIRNSIFLDLPKIKEETNSNDVSAILSLSDSIKSPKSSILNDSDFYNSFTLRKCKLLELNEKGKSTNALKLELSMNNFNASIERIVNETSFLPNNQMFSNPTNNTLAIETSLFPKRKSILKKSELGENLQKVNISNFEEMKIPEKKIILDKVVQLPKKAKKNKNIRYYKLMVNFFKEIVSYSKDDVMEHRIEELQNIKEQEELKQFQITKYQMSHIIQPPFRNAEVIKYLRNVQENLREYSRPRLPLKKSKKHLNFYEKTQVPSREKILKIFRNTIYPSVSPKIMVKKVKKNIKLVLKPLIDPDFNYNSMRKKLEQKITNTNIEEGLSNFRNIQEYREIQLEDVSKKAKIKYIWSGQDVLAFRLFDGVWTREKINFILQSLSTKFQDNLIWLTGFDGYIKIFHKKLKLCIDSRYFSKFIFLLIIGNTMTISSTGLINSSEVELIAKLNIFFITMFTFEMFLKILCFGEIRYLRDLVNVFDALIVVLGLIEICLIQLLDSSSTSLKILSIFRVLRVIRILRSLKFMKTVINVMKRSLKSIFYISLLLFLFLFIYALLGMNLFSGSFTNKKIPYRQNFDSYNNAFISVFQILTQSTWQYILYLTMNTDVNKFISCFYLISWILIGNYLFLNLFLAILLDEFYKESQKLTKNREDDIEENNFKERIESIEKEIDKVRDITIKEKISKETSFLKNSKEIFSLNKYCKNIIEMKHFGHFMQFLILLSSISLIIDTYIIEGNIKYILVISDGIINFCFFSEFLLKIVAEGLIYNKNSYFRDSWNIMDFFILIASVLSTIREIVNFPSNKFFELLKIWKPLRFISHNINMKIVVTALMDSISSIFHILILIFFVWLIFGIIGVALLSERLGYCQGTPDYYGINKKNCEEIGREWGIFNTNFDNILNALITLFVVASREIWPDIMYLCVDSNTSDIGPIKGNYPYIILFYFIFILIGSYFLMNLFVGVLIYHFTKAQKNEQSKSSIFLTQNQIKWLNIQKMIAKAKPDFLLTSKPKNAMKLIFYNIFQHKIFNSFIYILICLNLLVLSLKHSGSSKTVNKSLNYANLIMILLFFSEFIIKSVVFGFVRYLDSSENCFELVINSITVLEIILTNVNILDENSKISNFLTIFSVLRIYRLIPLFKGAKKVLENLSYAIPSFLNVGGLLLLIFFLYAEIGVILFSEVATSEVITKYNNFENFTSTLIILFKILSGDEWFLVMFEAYKNPNGGALVSIIFFLSFFTLCSYIMVNVFILIIIQQFEQNQIEEENPIQTFKENLENFRKIWAEFSAGNDTAFINQKNLIDFYMKLEPPLGFGPNIERAKVALELMKMKLEGDVDGNLFFNELLFASMKRIFGPELLENTSSEIQALLQLEEKKIRKKMEKKKSKISQKYSGFGSFFSSAKHFAALKKHSVNPIITILFVGMALKTWKRFAQRKINGELLPNDSLPYIYMEEESSYESSVSEKSLSSYVASKEDSSSYESKISLRESQINENEEFDSKNDDSIEKKSESLSSGSKLSIDDIEEIKKIQLNKGRRFKRFSQLSLLKDFLWNKAEGKKNSIRSSNMFINFLGRHSSNFSERSKFLEG